MLALCWTGLMMLLNFNPFGHAVHDSFTLMAESWLRGSIKLIDGENYPFLELAIYNGDYYVSFPSVPALFMVPLTLLFGRSTPNTLMVFCYMLVAYMGAYKAANVWRDPLHSMFAALFMTMGCNLLQFSLQGGVWNQGQLCNFMFLALFMAGISGRSRLGWGAGLFCLALSVGCRPFSAAYVPLGLWLLYKKLNPDAAAFDAKRLLRMVPYIIAPALVALGLFWYNFARFGNPFEFGHNWLPEHTRDPNQPMMGLRYIWKNIVNLMRLPKFEGNRLVFTDVKFSGFAFWLVNPIYDIIPVLAIIKAIKRKWHVADTLFIAGMALELLLLLMHKTLGGWQFGARYLCDLVPIMLFYIVYERQKSYSWEYLIMMFAVAFNIYGAACFHLVEGGY